jgi:hypothetical protein
MFGVAFILSWTSSVLLIALQSAWLQGDPILEIASVDREVFLNHSIMPSAGGSFSSIMECYQSVQ